MAGAKKYAILLLIGLLSACVSPSVQHHDPYKEFMASFSDSTQYAWVEMAELSEPILMLSHETFENGTDGTNAISAILYGTDERGKIVCYGEVRSQGTAYPLSWSGGTILTAGHHYVRRFVIDGNPLSLYIFSDSQDTDGDDVYQGMLDEFIQAKPIVFKKINE